MSLISVLERIKNAVHPLIERNALLDALLGAPGDELAYGEGKIEAWSYGADDIETGTVSVTALSNTVNLANGGSTVGMAVDDDFVIAGSKENNSGRFKITAINSNTQLVLNNTFKVTEAGLFYGKTKPRLIRIAKGLALFPGGYETDAVIRTDILGKAGDIHKKRGTSIGVEEDFERITNAQIQIIDPVKPLTSLQAGVATTANGATMTVASWASGLAVSDDFTVSLSTKGSNGRYFVYSNTGTVLTPARRAVNTGDYFTEITNASEVHFKELREGNRLYFRVINKNGGASNRVAVTITVSGATIITSGINGGAAGDTVTLSSSTVAITKSSAGVNSYWDVTTNQAKEGWIELSSIGTGVEVSVNVTESVGTLNAVRWGRAGLASRNKAGVLSLGVMPSAKFGGLIKTAFRSGLAETGLTVYKDSYHGFFLGFGYPGTFENDDYTIVSPDDFVALDIDHRNYANYSEQDLKILARDYLMPYDCEYILGFI